MENGRIRRIILVQGASKLWTVKNLSWSAGIGFVYGMLYCMQKLAPPGKLRLVVRYEQRLTKQQVVLHNIAEMLELLPDINFLFAPFYFVTSLDFLTNNTSPGYNYWVRDNQDRGQHRAILITDTTGESLQGLFSVLDACNVRRSEVLLSKPYKDGMFYNVDNMQLVQPR